MCGTLGAVRSNNRNRDVAAHGDKVAIGIACNVAVTHHDLTVEIAFNEGRVRDVGRATDVEGTHGELRAWLADRLSSDNTNGLAHVNRRAAGKIATIAGAANAVWCFTC